jgi:kynurenine formamidase
MTPAATSATVNNEAVRPTTTVRTAGIRPSRRAGRLTTFLSALRTDLMADKYRLIDLSVPLEHASPSEPAPATIRYARHDCEGLAQMQHLLGVRPEDLVYSGGLGWAVEEVQAITHTGTHVDAPYHYGPTSAGKPARTIDQVPLEWCFAPGVILDVRHKAAGDFITVADLQAALERITYQLRPLDIVLLRTGADKRLGSPDYFAQPGLGREGVLWLVEQGVKRSSASTRTRWTGRSSTWWPITAAPATAATSGRHISRGSTANTARSKSWPISISFLGRTALSCRACR